MNLREYVIIIIIIKLIIKIIIIKMASKPMSMSEVIGPFNSFHDNTKYRYTILH